MKIATDRKGSLVPVRRVLMQPFAQRGVLASTELFECQQCGESDSVFFWVTSSVGSAWSPVVRNGASRANEGRVSNVGADAALRKLAAIYANGIRDGEAFDDMLRLRTKLIPYDGDDSWVEPTLRDVADCLASEHAPEPASSCAFCDYVAKASAAG